MSISVKYVLPKSHSLEEFTRAKFAHQSRRWWGLWNWGHPVPEIIEQEVTKKTLKVVFNANKSPGKKLSSEETSLVFSRFCWEFARFRQTTVLPHTKIGFCWEETSIFSQFDETLPRLMVLPQILENHSDSRSLPDINDTSSVLRKAWSYLRPFTPSLKGLKNLPSKVTLDTAITHANDFSNLQIPALGKTEMYNSEELELVFIRFRQEIRPTPFVESKTGKMWNFSLRKNGIILREMNNPIPLTKPRTGLRLPVRISNKDTVPSTIQNTWNDMLGAWMGENDPQTDLTTEVCRLAELLEEYALVYPAERVDDHPQKPAPGHYVYRLDRKASHPVWGEMKRLNSRRLFDYLYRNSDKEHPEVAIGNNVPHFKDETTFRLIGVHDDDSELVLLKGEPNPPAVGWLKPVDEGTHALIRRKKKFQRHAMRSRVISRLFLAANENRRDFWGKNKMWKGKWRLNTKAPLHLVIGPPGTGKTWTAVKLVADILRREPHARVLVCAKEHFALNHLALSIRDDFDSSEDLGHHKLVRILPVHKEESIFAGDYEALEEFKPEREGRRAWEPRIRAGSKYREFNSLWTEIEREISGLTAPWVAKSAITEASVICTTTMDYWLDEMFSQSEPPTFDYVLIEEAGKSYPSELIAPMALSREWVLIGDDMQLPPYKLRETRENVNTILGLGSKIPESDFKENRGDPHLKGLVDKFYRGFMENQDPEAVIQWLQPFSNFKRFAEEVGVGTHFLNQQYRMERDLSDIISNVFYGVTFEHKKKKRLWKRPKNRLLSGEHPLLWVDTPSIVANRKWSESPRYLNIEEAKIISKIVGSLAPKDLDVKILTPYNSQKFHLQKKLRKHRNWICSVDEFQGREADIVILSLVRNNMNTKPRSRWGFMLEPRRLNVMFSRAREVLIVIGSLAHISSTEFESGLTELGDVAKKFQARARILNPTDFFEEMKK